MVLGAERLAQMGSAILTDGQKEVSEAHSLLTADFFQAFAHGFGDGIGHGLASERGQLFDQALSRVVLDVQSH